MYRIFQLSLGGFLRLPGRMLHYKYTDAEVYVILGKDYLGGGVFISLSSLGDWTPVQ